jgi:putative MFS transporter
MGAIFPIPYILAAELTPARFRGPLTGVLDAFLSVGYFAAPLLAAAIIPRQPADTGWRWLFFLGAVPLLYIPALLRWLPESPRWLATRGRTDEADRIVAGMEAASARSHARPARSAGPHAANSARTATVTAADIFHPGYRRRTAMLWIAFPCLLFVFYAVQTYTPTVLIKQGYGLSSAFRLTALIVVISIPGKIAEAFAVERFGRKATIIWFGAVSAAAAIVFGFSHSLALTIFAGALLSFFGVGVDPAIKIYSAEQYPTAIRETGVGLAEGMGRLLGGALAPFIMALVLGVGGVAGSYIFVAAVALVGVIAVAVLGTETRGQDLETATAASPSAAHVQPKPETETA